MTDEETPLEPPQHVPSVPPPPPPPPSEPASGSWSASPYGASPTATTNGYAIASLVLGIVGPAFCAIPSILALVFGYKARNEIDGSGGTQKGRGMAIAGIVLGWVWIALMVIGIVLVALVPSDS